MRESDSKGAGSSGAITLPKRLKSQATGFDERGIPAALGGNGPPSQMGRVMAPAKVPCWHEVWELLLARWFLATDGFGPDSMAGSLGLPLRCLGQISAPADDARQDRTALKRDRDGLGPGRSRRQPARNCQAVDARS